MNTFTWHLINYSHNVITYINTVKCRERYIKNIAEKKIAWRERALKKSGKKFSN